MYRTLRLLPLLVAGVATTAIAEVDYVRDAADIVKAADWERMRTVEVVLDEFGYEPDSLRFEKGYGVWTTEFSQAYTPGMSGLDKFIAFDKGDFIGRDAAMKERDSDVDQRLVLLEIDSDDADVVGFEPVWSGGRRVGFTTGGSYGHFVKKSLALAYVDAKTLASGADLVVSVIGENKSAAVLPEPPYDPTGGRLRG